MNSLVVFSEEIVEPNTIILSGSRAQQVYHGSDFGEGQQVCVAQYGGQKFRARVVMFSEARVELEITEAIPSLPLRHIDLVVGLSRPQTTKKVVQAAVMAGVRSLHLVHTDSGEKSYLDSHLLRPEDLKLEIAKALEQVWEGAYPEIRVHRSFTYFCKNTLGDLGRGGDCFRAIAMPGAPLIDREQLKRPVEEIVFAVGSEAGWSDREVAAFRERGFVSVGLGQRVVRVELAVSYLLGQSLLFE